MEEEKKRENKASATFTVLLDFQFEMLVMNSAAGSFRSFLRAVRLHLALCFGTLVPSALCCPVTGPAEVHHCRLSAAIPIRRLHLPS